LTAHNLLTIITRPEITKLLRLTVFLK